MNQISTYYSLLPQFIIFLERSRNNHIPIRTDGDFVAIKIDTFIWRSTYQRLLNPLWV